MLRRVFKFAFLILLDLQKIKICKKWKLIYIHIKLILFVNIYEICLYKLTCSTRGKFQWLANKICQPTSANWLSFVRAWMSFRHLLTKPQISWCTCLQNTITIVLLNIEFFPFVNKIIINNNNWSNIISAVIQFGYVLNWFASENNFIINIIIFMSRFLILIIDKFMKIKMHNMSVSTNKMYL